MKSKKKRELLDHMARIERMERGKICKMAGRKHYNHQTWRDGRNLVRYVPAGQLASLQEAIEGYKLFIKLAEEYADEVIRETRAASAESSKRTARAQKGNKKKNA